MSKLQEVLSQFRQTVYQVFEASRDAAFELIDAIASSPNARSAVEVSDSPLMERNYASVYKGLERTKIDEGALRTALVKQADESGELMVAGYAIQALDHTPLSSQRRANGIGSWVCARGRWQCNWTSVFAAGASDA